jgi:hypothetical protein
VDEQKATWRAWKEATFGTDYMIWHDGLYTGGIARREGEARAETLRMLLLGLQLGDPVAAEALGAMRAGEALEGLRALLPTTHGRAKVKVALAIHEIEPNPDLAEDIIEVLRSHPLWGDRIDAAIALRRFPAAKVDEALLSSVAHDPDYLVRNHAAESYLHVHCVHPPEIAEHRTIFGDIVSGDDREPTPEDFERFARAVEALLTLAGSTTQGS